MAERSLRLVGTVAPTPRRATSTNLQSSIVINPGSKDLALVGPRLVPWKRALYDSALLDILLECWSNGVLEKRKPSTEP